MCARAGARMRKREPKRFRRFRRFVTTLLIMACNTEPPPEPPGTSDLAREVEPPVRAEGFEDLVLAFRGGDHTV